MKITRRRRIATYVCYVLIALWVVGPIYWMTNTSLHSEPDMLSKTPPLLPSNPTLFNFSFIFDVEAVMRERLEAGLATFFLPTIAGSLPAAIRNSAIVGLVVMALNVIFAPFAAYAFYRVRYRGSYPLFLSTVLTRLMPGIAVILPLYAVMKILNLLDTYLAVITVHSMFTMPLSMWVSYSFLEGLPVEIEEAALIDGYSRFEVYRRIVFPIMKGAMVAVGLFSFMLSYSEFLFAFLLTQTDASRTVPVIVAAMGANPVMPRTIMAAAGIIAMLLPVVVFILMRRYIIRGLTAGVVVGR